LLADYYTMLKELLNILYPSKCLICRKKNSEVFCLNCQTKIEFISDAVAITKYISVIKYAIRMLKFHGKIKLAAPLGKISSDYLLKKNFDCVVVVPLHANRIKKRGCNQCDLIAKEICKIIDVELISNVLARVKDTKPQFTLKKHERLLNVLGAFDVINSDKIIGKTILLLDDIYTTGATINECQRVLLEHGAKKCIPFCLSKA